MGLQQFLGFSQIQRPISGRLPAMGSAAWVTSPLGPQSTAGVRLWTCWRWNLPHEAMIRHQNILQGLRVSPDASEGLLNPAFPFFKGTRFLAQVPRQTRMAIYPSQSQLSSSLAGETAAKLPGSSPIHMKNVGSVGAPGKSE